MKLSHSLKVFQNVLNYTPIQVDFYEQAKHIRGSQTNFTFSPRPLNSRLEILKNILEREEWVNRSQEFSHSEPIESDRDLKEIKEKYLQLMLFLPYVFPLTEWEKAITTSHQRSIFKIQKPLEVLIYRHINSYFCQNNVIPFCDPVPVSNNKAQEDFMF